MKILFICDWDFTDLWRSVAIDLKKKSVIGDCDALIVGKVWYEKLNNQKKVFDKTWLLQDHVENSISVKSRKHRLKELDEKYGNPTIWRYLWADRSWIYESYEDGEKLLISAFDFFEGLYTDSRPDFIITTSGYASMPHLVSFAVAEKLKIPILSLLHSRFESYLIPSYNPYNNIDWIDSYLRKPDKISDSSKSKAKNYLSNFRLQQKKPDYSEIIMRYRGLDLNIIFRFFRYIYRYYINGVYANDHTKKSPFQKIIGTIKPKVGRLYFNKLIRWDQWDKECDYIYFPLHCQPEASTMTLSPFYLNQPSVIENIAKSLPGGIRVIVKEHPEMIGKRGLEYYRRLQRIVNVDVVSPVENSFELTKKAKLIVTITGTVGFEGLMLKKPVITLGDTLFNKCSLVRQLKDVAPTQWNKHIKEMIDNYQYNEDILLNYLSAIVENGEQMLCMEPGFAPDEILSKANVDKISYFIEGEIAKYNKIKRDD
jgi:hypothetical protein